jgi:hypothetical protein
LLNEGKQALCAQCESTQDWHRCDEASLAMRQEQGYPGDYHDSGGFDQRPRDR